MRREWLKGKLLVALPSLVDDNFDHSVILVLAHGVQGALGVVLNRPTPVGIAGLFPGLMIDAAEPRVLFTGGPVNPDGVICLAGAPAQMSEGFSPVLAGWGSIDPREPTPDGVHSVRVYRGYAGWSAGQLEAELASNAWVAVDAATGDLATDQPERLWPSVLARQRPAYARLAHFPPDPSLN